MVLLDWTEVYGKRSNHQNMFFTNRYRGIGIRIEDDILMTKAGPYVLSAELPKEVEDVEELLSQRTF